MIRRGPQRHRLGPNANPQQTAILGEMFFDRSRGQRQPAANLGRAVTAGRQHQALTVTTGEAGGDMRLADVGRRFATIPQMCVWIAAVRDVNPLCRARGVGRLRPA